MKRRWNLKEKYVLVLLSLIPGLFKGICLLIGLLLCFVSMYGLWISIYLDLGEDFGINLDLGIEEDEKNT